MNIVTGPAADLEIKSNTKQLIFVELELACFDRACDQAYEKAISILRLDGERDWDEERLRLVMEFQSYRRVGTSAPDRPANFYCFQIWTEDK